MIQRPFSRSLTGIAAFALSLWMLSEVTCGPAESAKQGCPLVLFIDYDETASVVRFPELTSAHLDRLLRLIATRGGSACFGVIAERSDEPPLCVDIRPVVGRLDERARLATLNRTAVQDWKGSVLVQVARGRKAQRTDFYGSVATLNHSLLGRGVSGDRAEMAAIVVSDGIDTTHRKKSIPKTLLPSDVKVVTVGMAGDLATKFFGERVVLSPTIDGALDAISGNGEEK